jgi:hypothetical protein
VVVWSRLYTSGRRKSPNIPRNTKKSPIIRTMLLSISRIESIVRRPPPHRGIWILQRSQGTI